MVLAGEDRGTRKNNRNRLSFETYGSIQGQPSTSSRQLELLASFSRELTKIPTPLISPKKTPNLSSREQPSISPCCCSTPTLLSRLCPYLPDLMFRMRLHMGPKSPCPTSPHTYSQVVLCPSATERSLVLLP